MAELVNAVAVGVMDDLSGDEMEGGGIISDRIGAINGGNSCTVGGGMVGAGCGDGNNTSLASKNSSPSSLMLLIELDLDLPPSVSTSPSDKGGVFGNSSASWRRLS